MSIQAFVEKHKNKRIDLDLLKKFRTEFGEDSTITFVFEEEGGKLTGNYRVTFITSDDSHTTSIKI